jgi:hypothetical protein
MEYIFLFFIAPIAFLLAVAIRERMPVSQHHISTPKTIFKDRLIDSLKTALLTCLLVSIPVIHYKFWEKKWNYGLLPAEVEVTEILSVNQTSIGTWGCGVVLFKLADEAAIRLKNNGLGVLEAAQKSRGMPDDKKHIPIFYNKWSSTPVLKEKAGKTERWRYGLECANLDKDISDQIAEELYKPNSFYTTKSNSESAIFIFPDLKMVMFSSSDS